MARGLFAVLESELETEVIPAADENLERVEELEAQVAQADVVESEGEVEELVQAVEEAVDGVEELGDIAEVAEDSVEAGVGLTEEAAEIAEVAVESICNRLGYKPAKRIVPSMESFGATSSRLDATKYALEGFKDTIAKIWAGIKAFFVKVGEKLKELWLRLTDLATKTSARAAAMGKKVEKAVADKLVADPAKKLDVAKYFKVFGQASSVTAAAFAIIKAHKDAVDKQAAINTKLAAKLEAVSKAESVDGLELTDADFAGMAKSEFAYNRVVEVKDGVLSLTEAVVKAEDKVEVEAFALAQLGKLVSDVKAYADAMASNKDLIAKAGEVVKKAVSLADKLAKKEGTAEQVKEKAKAFRTVQANLVVVNKDIPVLGLKACGAALELVGANLKAYGAAPAK